MGKRISRRRAWLWCAEILAVVGILAGVPEVHARTWIASADGASGDGTVDMILPQVQDADSLRLLAGVHVWSPFATRSSMTLVGDPSAVVSGFGPEFRGVEFVRIFDVVFEGLINAVVVAGSREVLVQGVVYRDCAGSMVVVLTDSATFLNSEFVDNDNGGMPTTESGGLIVGHGDVTIDHCVFVGNRATRGLAYDKTLSGGGALMLDGDVDAAIVKRCVFENNESGSGSAMHSKAKSLLFEKNTVVRNDCESGAVVVHARGTGRDDTIIRQNVFAENAAFGLWISETAHGTPQLYCNAFWENNLVARIGDFYEREDHQWRAAVVVGYDGVGDNFNSTLADPMFCDSLVVHAESELATQEFPCEPIGGAHGIGCTLNPTKSTSWGQLKGLFGN